MMPSSGVSGTLTPPPLRPPVRGSRRSSSYACKRCSQHKKKCQPPEGPCSNCMRVGIECSRVKDGPGCNPNGRLLVEPLQEAIRHVEDELMALNLASMSAGSSPGSKAGSGIGKASSLSPGTSAAFAIPGPASRKHVSAPTSPGHHHQKSQDVTRYRFGTDTAVQVWRSVSRSVGRRCHHLDRLYSSAELPFPLTLRHRSNNSLPRRSQDTSDAPDAPEAQAASRLASLLPRNVTERLIQVYIDRIVPQCPVFSPAELRGMYQRVFHEPQTPQINGDTFLIVMAMAVATLTSKSDAQKQVMDLAEALRVEALRSDPDDELLSTTSIRCLQGLLLLTQYGLLMPSAVDVWFSACEAMRVAVELGLHREPPEASNLSREAIQARRRLFWATYSVERNVTLTIHRPFAIRDDQIKLNVFPSAALDTPALAWANPSGTARYLTHLAYCIILTEITAVNVGNEPFPAPFANHAEWLASCELRIDELRNSNHKKEPAVLLSDWKDMPAWRCLAFLYMPCPRNPYPTDATVAKFVKVLVSILDTYLALAQKRSLILSWPAVHHAYEVGTQMLYCMQNYPHIVQEAFPKAVIVDAVTHVSEFFTYMEERWPAAMQCRVLLEKLSKNIIEAFLKDQPPKTLLYGPSDEQRVVDLIFRKNGYSYFAGEETDTFDMQSYLVDSFTDTTMGDVFDMTPSDADAFLNSFDVYDETLLLAELGNDSFLEWPAMPASWGSDKGTSPQNVSVASLTSAASARSVASGTSAAHSPSARSVERMVKAQELVSVCRQNLESLPVCKFCRQKRIKCSRTLPSCHNCVDYGHDCLYNESYSGQWVSGSQLHQLQEHLSRAMHTLEKRHCNVGSSPGAEQSFYEGTTSLPRMGPRTLLLEYETSFGMSTCLWGETSIIGKLVSAPLPPVPRAPDIRAPVLPAALRRNPDPLMRSLRELPDDALNVFFERYTRTIEVYYPILGKEGIPRLLADFRSKEEEDAPSNGNGKKQSMAEAFLNLVVAIALVQPFSARSATFSTALYYYDSAMTLASETAQLFVKSSIESLQFALLMCVYVRLHPNAGNLSRVASAACRICLDLLESPDLNADDTVALHVLFRTAYVMDTDVAVEFGRPNYLPEWKTSEKMVVHPTACQEKGRIALLSYMSAKLRSAIHTAVLKFEGSSDGSVGGPQESATLPPASLIDSFRAQLADWWSEYQQRTAVMRHPATLDDGPPYNGQDGMFHYGAFTYFQTISLLRLLERIVGSRGGSGDGNVPDGSSLTPAAYGETLIKTNVAFASIAKNYTPQSRNTVDYDFAVCWSHYKDIFEAGLELLVSPDCAKYTNQTPLRKKPLLDSCHNLLRLFEMSIGTHEWVLSERLNLLIEASDQAA